MRLKVLAYTFSVPLVWATMLLLQFTFPDFGISRSFSSAVLIGLFIGSLIGRFLLEDKYLTDIFIDNENLSLTYLKPIARQYQITIHLSTLSDVKLKKKLFLIRDFGSVTFLSKDNQITFQLLGNNTKQAIRQLKEVLT